MYKIKDTLKFVVKREVSILYQTTDEMELHVINIPAVGGDDATWGLIEGSDFPSRENDRYAENDADMEMNHWWSKTVTDIVLNNLQQWESIWLLSSDSINIVSYKVHKVQKLYTHYFEVKFHQGGNKCQQYQSWKFGYCQLTLRKSPLQS